MELVNRGHTILVPGFLLCDRSTITGPRDEKSVILSVWYPVAPTVNDAL